MDKKTIRMTQFIITFVFVTLLGSCATTSSDGLKQLSPEQKKANLYYDYGTNALVNKDYTKALTNLKKAIEIDDENSHFQNNLGMAFYFKGDSKSAIKHLEKSIELDSKNSDAKNNLASVYFNIGEKEKAQNLYLSILKDLEYNKQFRIYYNLGLLELEKRKVNSAVAYFKKSIKDNKSYCPSHYQLGVIASQSHNYHQAANSFQNAALGTCAKNPDPHFKEAEALLNLGETGKAILKFREVSDLFPKSNYAVLADRKIQSIQINKSRVPSEKQLRSQLNLIEKEQRKSSGDKQDKVKESLQF